VPEVKLRPRLAQIDT
jgi:hypothetical protein